MGGWTEDLMSNQSFHFLIQVLIELVAVFKSRAGVSKITEYNTDFRTVLISILYALSRRVAPPALYNSRRHTMPLRGNVWA